jgi:PAS domain-containing protein
MDLSVYFKSIVEQDRNAVVICNLDHEIIYMNPAAIAHFAKRGGEQLVGRSLLACHNAHSCDQIIKTVQWFEADQSHNIIHTMYNEKQNKDIYMVALRDETGALIGYYEKHEYRNPETEATYNFQ